MIDHVPAFSALLRSALGRYLRPGADSFVEMFAPNGIMEFPYGLPDFETIEGRAVLAERLQNQGGQLAFVAMSAPTVHPVTDGRTFVVEFVGTIRGVATGQVSDHKLISVITLEDGLITRYRDYWNPLSLLATLRGEAWLTRILDESAV